MSDGMDSPSGNAQSWNNTWWGTVVLILFWPFSLTYHIYRKNWKFGYKIAAFSAIWIIFFVISIAGKSTPALNSSILGIQSSVSTIPSIEPSLLPEVSPLIEAILTPTESPTIVPTQKPIPTLVPATTTSPDYYTNIYGNKVQSPTYNDSVPTGASAKCKDGTYSFSQHRSGTCSHHGGVSVWY
jgi:hypothetical protein